ncbi:MULTISPECIES: A24 family peptidase [unclassified Leptolyngbya]|uniref:prepilin peptidase n=1 Tax=unclassified Leptolyngbya TaxID=2650499 RepID=UPI001681F1DA|nr:MULTISPECIES: A24 family peptidase [unclassified Leptolyngbya]MBD1914010.1 prepilin peptidase [Leptolyngbya sp. FACHB-8]MBD2154262.1 prepilin peptidase [Leptolyngbya sp. FACHB-16]
MEAIVSGVLGAIVFMIGACIGSFLNVVVYRLPAGISLIHPPSRCPKCRNTLKPYDNVPVLGWLWLRGRCRYCKTRISPRYPLIETATGLLFVAVWWAFGWGWIMLGYWVLFSWLIALSFIDLDTMTLPNPLTQSGLVLGLVFQAALGWLYPTATGGVPHTLMTGIVGAVVGMWIFTLISVVGAIALGQAAMGGGDAKLAAMMGAWLGWSHLLLAGLIACFLGALVGGGAIALKLISRRQPIPFGPFLALSAILAVFFGDSLLYAYRQLFFPMF